MCTWFIMLHRLHYYLYMFLSPNNSKSNGQVGYIMARQSLLHSKQPRSPIQVTRELWVARIALVLAKTLNIRASPMIWGWTLMVVETIPKRRPSWLALRRLGQTYAHVVRQEWMANSDDR